MSTKIYPSNSNDSEAMVTENEIRKSDSAFNQTFENLNRKKLHFK